MNPLKQRQDYWSGTKVKIKISARKICDETFKNQLVFNSAVTTSSTSQ